MATIAQRVAKGAALLDEKIPGWPRMVEVAILDIDDPCKCVLGQVRRAQIGDDYYSAYGAMVSALHLIEEEVYGFGFDAWNHDEIPALTAAWRTLIEARRAGEPR